MLMNVTYNLKLRNAIFIYCTSRILPINVKWLFGHYKTSTTLPGKKIHQ